MLKKKSLFPFFSIQGAVISFFQILIDVSDHLERRLSRRCYDWKINPASQVRWKTFWCFTNTGIRASFSILSLVSKTCSKNSESRFSFSFCKESWLKKKKNIFSLSLFLSLSFSFLFNNYKEERFNRINIRIRLQWNHMGRRRGGEL